jgi:hypothetical protein
MSVQEQLLGLLLNTTDADERVYPIMAPDGVAKPYIVYQRVLSNTENTLSGNAGITNTRMQLDIYADTYAGAQALFGQLDALMSGWAVQNISLHSQDLYESAVKLYRVLAEYSIWHH